MNRLHFAICFLGNTFVAAPMASANSYPFQTLSNLADPAFNQFPGISYKGTMVSYVWRKKASLTKAVAAIVWSASSPERNPAASE